MVWYYVNCRKCGVKWVGTERQKDDEVARHEKLAKYGLCKPKNLKVEVWKCERCGEPYRPTLSPLVTCKKCSSQANKHYLKK